MSPGISNFATLLYVQVYVT